jgi:hypothetical protein
MKRSLLFLCNILVISASVYGQKYFGATQEEFGKNRIQLKRFEWKTIKSNNFEFNYYRGGELLSQMAAKTSETEYEKITETLGYTPFTTMKIFIYNSPKDIEQSNIGLTSPSELDGGAVNLAKARIQIAFAGNDSLFKKQLIKEITSLFVYDMLYGGSLKEVLQSSLLLTVPEWYMSGISSYIAEGSNSQMFDTFKTTIQKASNKKLSHLQGEEAAIVGQSIWNYIAVKYGRDNISNILNLTRIIRNEQSSITSTLGISYNRFIREWKAFYLENQTEVTNEEPAKTELPKTKPVAEQEVSKLSNLKPGEIDTDFYEFDPKNVVLVKENKDLINSSSNLQSSLNTKLKRPSEEFKLSAPKAYQNLLISNDNKFDIHNDPVRRFGVSSKLVLNDLLENHIITFYGFVTPSTPFFKNHDLYVEYGNYEKKVDWKVKFERRSTNFERIDDQNSYLFRPLKILVPDQNNLAISRRTLYQRVSGTIVYPFTKFLKLEGVPSAFMTSDIDYIDLPRSNLNAFYGGLQANIIFDNAVTVSRNIEKGTRGKLSLEKNISFTNKNQNFNRINLDLRHYQKLVNGIYFAGRFNYGRSLGNSPKYTFLGGVENWLIDRRIHKINGSNTGVPTNISEINFYNFAGNLRGFDFAKLYGTNHLLVNLELRFSLSSYFPRSSISSSFLRNLQLVAFNDIGTAWNGNQGPLSRQNSLNTEIIGGAGNPFYVEVTNFKNPFLIGYGVGARTTILGFLVKVDYAYGLENKEVGKPKLYVSVGNDF